MWCSTIRTVRAARRRARSGSARRARRRPRPHTPAIGSSSRITRGSPASSIASSSLRLSPCDERARRAVRARWPSPTRSSARRARSSAVAYARRPPPEAERPAEPRLARPAGRSRATRQQREDARDLERPAEPAPASAGAAGRAGHVLRRRARCCPSRRPVDPQSRLNSDVLPAPFGPMMPRNSPSRTSSVTSATMRRAADVQPEAGRRGSERCSRRHGPSDAPLRPNGLLAGAATCAGAIVFVGTVVTSFAVRRLPVSCDLEHRLDQRVVLRRGSARLPFGPVELPALERRRSSCRRRRRRPSRARARSSARRRSRPA